MGIFSHFRENNKKACYVQYKRYEKFSLIAKKYNSKIISHICSSASAILFPEYRQDMVRIGILMYGYNPTNNTQIKVKPALKIYAKKIQDRNLKKGQNLLYGNYNLQNNKKISIIKYGYADGATRSSGTYNNRCMDLSATKRCKAYKIVLNNADILAKMHNTIAYEILVSYTIRCNYIYYENYCRKT